VFGKQTGVLFNEGSTKWVPDQNSSASEASDKSDDDTEPQNKLKKGSFGPSKMETQGNDF
jgi:hypothetical protein